MNDAMAAPLACASTPPSGHQAPRSSSEQHRSIRGARLAITLYTSSVRRARSVGLPRRIPWQAKPCSGQLIRNFVRLSQPRPSMEYLYFLTVPRLDRKQTEPVAPLIRGLAGAKRTAGPHHSVPTRTLASRLTSLISQRGGDGPEDPRARAGREKERGKSRGTAVVCMIGASHFFPKALHSAPGPARLRWTWTTTGGVTPFDIVDIPLSNYPATKLPTRKPQKPKGAKTSSP